jgi:hypothetical protein
MVTVELRTQKSVRSFIVVWFLICVSKAQSQVSVRLWLQC